MDNFNLRKFLTEGKLYESNSSREKQHLLKWMDGLSSYFDNENNYFEVDELDMQSNGDGTDIVHDFIIYLNHEYESSSTTPDLLDEYDVDDFLNNFTKKDYSSDFINENEGGDIIDKYHSYLMKSWGKELAGTVDQHRQGVENMAGDVGQYIQNEVNYFESIGREDLQDIIEKFINNNKDEMDNFNLKRFMREQYLKEDTGSESDKVEQLSKKYQEVLSAFITFTHGEYNTGLSDDDISDFFKWAQDGDYDFNNISESSSMNELDNDDAMADLNDVGSNRNAKGGDEEDYFRTSYRQARGTKVKASGEGKGPKRSFNKRKRKDAKNVLDKYKKEN
jgi:hypothetical protein